MKRRELLAAVSATVTTGLAGCSGMVRPAPRTREPFRVDPLPTTDQPTATEEPPTGEPTTDEPLPALPEAMVEFQNRSGEHPDVTLSVHRNDVLVGWERKTVPDGSDLWVGPLSVVDEYTVALEVGHGPAANQRWTVDRTWSVDLDSHRLRLVLRPDGELDATEVLRCQPDCRAVQGRANTDPVDTGEGQVRAARAVLRNESKSLVELNLHVAYGGQTVFDGIYGVSPATEIWIPAPVDAAGKYSVVAATPDGNGRHFWWHVRGNQASLSVLVEQSGRLLIGCDSANTLGNSKAVLFVRNEDEVSRTVDLSLATEYLDGATGTVAVEPGEWAALPVDVPIRGTFDATISVGEHTETATWNTCPYSRGGIWVHVQDGRPVILRES